MWWVGAWLTAGVETCSVKIIPTTVIPFFYSSAVKEVKNEICVKKGFYFLMPELWVRHCCLSWRCIWF